MQHAQITGLTIVLLTLVPTAGYSQGFQPRDQLMTFSLGAGRTSIDPPDFVWTDEKFPAGLVLPKREDGSVLEMSAGAMVARRLAIMGGFELLGGNDDVRLTNYQLHGGVRSWITKRCWVEGALGPTYTNVFAGEGEAQEESGTWGFGLLGVVGYDLLQIRNASFMARGHCTLHVQARMSSNAAGGVRANTLGLSLGFAYGW